MLASTCKKEKWKVLGMVAALFLLTAIVGPALILMIITVCSKITGKPEIYEDTNVSHYSWYMGEDARREYRNKLGMDEGIFPQEITDEMNVSDYKMVYYNPWDPQFLSYLTVEYDKEAYALELERLKEYSSTDYLGYYCVEGFGDEYELLAIEADPGYGFIYALNGDGEKIIYVELLFCNYFMDIDYRGMINESYLPVGFDATPGNPYRKQMGY